MGYYGILDSSSHSSGLLVKSSSHATASSLSALVPFGLYVFVYTIFVSFVGPCGDDWLRVGYRALDTKVYTVS